MISLVRLGLSVFHHDIHGKLENKTRTSLGNEQLLQYSNFYFICACKILNFSFALLIVHLLKRPTNLSHFPNKTLVFHRKLKQLLEIFRELSSLFRLKFKTFDLTHSWRRPLSCRNQSIDLQSKSIDWFLYDNGLRHQRVKGATKSYFMLH